MTIIIMLKYTYLGFIGISIDVVICLSVIYIEFSERINDFATARDYTKEKKNIKRVAGISEYVFLEIPDIYGNIRMLTVAR